MMRGARSSVQAAIPSRSGAAPRSVFETATRIACVALAGLFLANCANEQVARRGGKSKEIGAFPQAKYGPASARVVEEGQPVPKGGGRPLIGKAYSVAGKRYTPYDKAVGHTIVGTASWYGEAFHGRRTANGEVYDRHGISAAHPTMPLPAYARVTNALNNRSIIVRVNDRGPLQSGRVMEEFQRTADALAFRHLGTARVRVEYLGQASLGGSDDRLLLATLRTDGQPAAIPGTSARTQIASSLPFAAGRSTSADLDEQPVAPAVVSQPFQPQQPLQAEPLRVETVRAYAEPVRAIAPAAPVAATLASTFPPGVPVRGATLPPNRPFDLDTIASAGTPVLMRPSLTPQPVARPTTVASLFAAPEKAPSERFSRSHPLARDLVPQTLQPLSRN